MSGRLTPGHWSVRQTEGDKRYIVAGSVYVARIVHSANDARAIAAVPQLLEALEAHEQLHRDGILNTPDDQIAHVHALRRAALAAVRGEA